MGFFKKLFLGCFALGFILIGGSGTQSSNMLLQGGGFIGLVIGLVALYLFTKMAWRAMGCLPSFIVIMSIVCFVIYAIGGFNNGLGGVIENLKTFIGGRSTITSAQMTPEANIDKNTNKNTNQKSVKVDENFDENKPQVQEQTQAQPQEEAKEGGLMGLINSITGGGRPSRPADINSLPKFTSPVSIIKADTLNAQGYKVKLYGVAGPDFDQTCANRHGASYSCGQQAALWLSSWLTSNPITCRVMSKDKKTNMMLAVCSLGKYDIGAALVNAGWAVADTRESDIYVPYEQNAQAKRNGLWQGKFYKPWDWQAIKNRKSEYKVKVITPKDPNRKSFFRF